MNSANFKDALQELLFQSGLNAYQFSLQAGIPEANIYYWLADQYLPSVEYIVIIADYLNCSIEYLFGLTDDKCFIKAKHPSDFISRFTSLLKEKKCTKYCVAKNCGVGRSAISKWFHMQKMPKIETLVKLSEFFGCSIDYLIGRSDYQ